MHRVTCAVEERSMHAFGVDLWTQAAVHEPLLKPNRFQSACRHFTQQRRDVWTTKCAKADLTGIVVVWVAIIKRRASTGQNEKGMEVALEQNVDVYPLSDVATVAHVTRHWIKHVGRLSDASLYCEPGVEVGHVIDAGNGGRDLLLDLVRTEVAVLIKELRQVWSKEIARCQAAKER